MADPNAVTYSDGRPVRRQSRAEIVARDKARFEVQNKKRATMREYIASEKSKTLEQKMRETGRSEKFIQAHKNDTPKMQAEYNKAKRKAAAPAVKPVVKAVAKATPKPVVKKATPKPTLNKSEKEFIAGQKVKAKIAKKTGKYPNTAN